MAQQNCDLRDGIRAKDLNLVKKSLENGADVNQPLPGYKYNALFLAIDLQHLDLAEYLIDRGASVDYEDRLCNCQTPLTFAINKNSLNAVKLLVAKGANMNKVHLDGDTPLTHAVRLNKPRIAEYLLQRGADVNLTGWKEKTPLSWAVTKNNLVSVQILISYGADVSKADANGVNAMELARRSRNFDILDYLKSYKTANRGDTDMLMAKAVLKTTSESSSETSINQLDPEGVTPLLKAIDCGQVDVIRCLLTAGADTCKAGSDGVTPLLLAVKRKDVEVIKQLLDNGAEHTVHTAFLEAVSMGEAEIVELLLKKGAVVNVVYKNGHTPLTKAIEKENLDIIKCLVANGANINMPDGEGSLPLALAVRKGNLDVVKYLIDNSIPPQSLLESCPFLLKYIEENNFEMVQILVSLGVQLGLICGKSPLSKAVETENFKIVKFLVDKGADVNQSSTNGKVPLAIAAANRNLRLVKFLITAKADLALAEKEVEEFANENEDLAIYLDVLKGKYKKWESSTSLALSDIHTPETFRTS